MRSVLFATRLCRVPQHSHFRTFTPQKALFPITPSRNLFLLGRHFNPAFFPSRTFSLHTPLHFSEPASNTSSQPNTNLKVGKGNMLEKLARDLEKDKPERVILQFKEWSRLPGSPPPQAFAYAIEAAVRLNKAGLVKELYKELCASGQTPSAPVYNSLLRGLPLEAFDLFEEFVKTGFQPTALTFVVLMEAAKVQRDFFKAKQQLQRMRDFGIAPGMNIYASLLSVAVELKEAREGVELLSEMDDWGLRVPNDTILALLYSALDSRQDDAALQLFSRCRAQQIGPDEGTILEGLVLATEKNSVPLAEEIWEVIISQELEPSALIFDGLICAFAWNEEVGRALYLYQKKITLLGLDNQTKIRDLLCRMTSSKESVLEGALATLRRLHENGEEVLPESFNIILQSNVSRQQGAQCFDLVRVMNEEFKIPCSIDTFNALLRGALYCRSLRTAEDFYEFMLVSKVAPDEETFGILIGLAALSLQGPRLLHYYEQMNVWNVIPDYRHFTPLIEGLVRCSMMEEAETVLARMKSMGYKTFRQESFIEARKNFSSIQDRTQDAYQKVFEEEDLL